MVPIVSDALTKPKPLLNLFQENLFQALCSALVSLDLLYRLICEQG